MLEKPEFDCTNLGAFYDCGCAEDEKAEGDAGQAATSTNAKHDSAHDQLAVEISKEP